MNCFVQRLTDCYGDRSYLSNKRSAELDLYSDDAGLLWTKNERLCVPKNGDLRNQRISASHDHPMAGQYGVVRTNTKAKEIFHWQGNDKAVEQFFAQFESCVRGESTAQSWPRGIASASHP